MVCTFSRHMPPPSLFPAAAQHVNIHAYTPVKRLQKPTSNSCPGLELRLHVGPQLRGSVCHLAGVTLGDSGMATASTCSCLASYQPSRVFTSCA